MSALTNRYEDDDASHLPPGMKRVGYDADTERYTFREGDHLWLGEPGSFYGGQLKWAGKVPEAEEDEDDTYDSSTENTEGSGEHEHKASVEPLRQNAQESTQRTNGSPRNGVGSDPWGGVPVVSISATGAKPPDSPKDDSSIQMRGSTMKRVATLTKNALGITNRRPRKGI